MKIAILGAGAFGTALGGILAEKGFNVDYYDPQITDKSLHEVLDGAGMMLFAVPSRAVPYLLPRLPKNKPLIVATKGILSVDVFKEFEDFMVVSGPGFADDIRAGKETKLTATDERVVELFGTNYLTFDRTDDKTGVLMCGALKNVYAILAGLLGLKPGTEEHMQFLRDAAGEMRVLLAANGARAETVDLQCGVADLTITCAEPSRNYEFGMKLRGKPDYQPEKTVEGVTVLRKIKRGEIKVPEDVNYLRELMEVSEKWA